MSLTFSMTETLKITGFVSLGFEGRVHSITLSYNNACVGSLCVCWIYFDHNNHNDHAQPHSSPMIPHSISSDSVFVPLC